jgi:phosphoribosylpyrophosphate synthetase
MKLCQANGVKEVYAVIIHADFAQGVGEKFQNSELQKVYTTNSIEKPVERLEYYDKIQVLDISRVFSQAVT